jgi:FSR family fosmidomycin resistance protein-like MFS transporter
MLLIASRDEQRLNSRTNRTTPTRAAQQWTFIAVAMMAAFMTLVALRSSVQAIYQSYLPQLFESRGWDPALFGMLAGVFMGTGAVGQIMTGTIADQYGMRVAVVWPMLLSIPVGLAALLTPSVPLTFVACAMAGLLIGGQHSVLVVHAQRLLPFKQGLAAGLILGFTFASGAIGTGIAGHLADTVGIQQVMVAVTFIILPAAILALTLPGQRQKSKPAPAPAGD